MYLGYVGELAASAYHVLTVKETRTCLPGSGDVVQSEITTRPNRRAGAEVHPSYAPPTARHARRTSSAGFSLIELLVVMAIILIVAAFAVPSMKSTMDAYRLRTTLNSVSGLTQRC